MAALVAGGAAGYTSTNGGAAWVLKRPPTGFAPGSFITSSADGRVLIAASTRDSTGQFASNIFVSTNSGQTWFTAGARVQVLPWRKQVILLLRGRKAGLCREPCGPQARLFCFRPVLACQPGPKRLVSSRSPQQL